VGGTAVGQDGLYEEAAAACGAAIERLARAYEPHPDKRRDLIQDIHVALWRSLASFDGRCSMRTWVYRVAHNTATSQVLRRRAKGPAMVSLDELASMTDGRDGEQAADRHLALERLLALVQTLEPLDRRVTSGAISTGSFRTSPRRSCAWRSKTFAIGPSG
jgi:RNA polymerase sigma-70 factor, ECF subfamily